MAINTTPPCIKCKSIPTYYRVEREGNLWHCITCFNCNVTTKWGTDHQKILYAWGVELGNNKAAAVPLSNCKKCWAPAMLVAVEDEVGIVKYTVKCSICKTNIRFPRKDADSIISLWNKLFGVKNG